MRRVDASWYVVSALAVVLVAVVVAVSIRAARRTTSAPPGTVAVLDADGTLRHVVEVGPRPEAIGVGGGRVWVAYLDGRRLAEIDATERRLVRTVATRATATSVAVAPGAVWYAGPAAAVRMQVPSGGVRVVPLRGSGAGRAAIARTADSVVVAHGRLLERLPPGGGAPHPLARSLGGDPQEVAPDEGRVWVADASQNGVYRVSLPSGRVLLRRVPGPPGRTIVTGAAVGAGAIWVTSADARELVRLDVNTGSALFHAAIGAQCGQVAFGAGAAWVACGDGTVWRVDGETNVAKATHLGGVPTGVAVAGDHVWVTIR